VTIVNRRTLCKVYVTQRHRHAMSAKVHDLLGGVDDANPKTLNNEIQINLICVTHRHRHAQAGKDP
jgi:hypothetical protein